MKTMTIEDTQFKMLMQLLFWIAMRLLGSREATEGKLQKIMEWYERYMKIGKYEYEEDNSGEEDY